MRNIKLFSFILLLLCGGILVSCGGISDFNAGDNTSASTPESTPASTPENTPESTPINAPDHVTESSPLPTKGTKGSKQKSASDSGEMDMIYGKWKILEEVGYGYIYGEFREEDYVGGVITISEDHIEYDVPYGKEELENPTYKLVKEDKDDFWAHSHANMENGFGFKSEKVTCVEVYDGKHEWSTWNGVTNMFYVRDEKHLIFEGPVYFLAEKCE